MTITIEDMVECAERELAMRRRVYPRWVDAGKMKKAEADEQLATMEAIAEYLKAERDEWKPIPPGDVFPAEPVLVSFYGYDGTGSGERFPHVDLRPAHTLLTLSPNTYAWRAAPAPAPLPPVLPRQGSLL